MIIEYASGGMRTEKGTEVLGRKPAPVPLCPPQFLQDLNWARTHLAAIGSRLLTASFMAWLFSYCRAIVREMNDSFVCLRKVTNVQPCLWTGCGVNWNSGRAIAQEVSRWVPTAAAQDRARVWSCGICGGQSGVGADFLRVLRFPLPLFTPPIAPQ
jgi:hypothetical protein